MEEIQSTISCPACHITVKNTDYFCFNCGHNLRPVPLSTSIWKQFLLYSGSIILVPFGAIWGWRYLRQQNTKAKIIGIICIVITIVTSVALTIYTINLINKVQDEIHNELQQYGY
jgi:hypothetical protein